MTTSSPVQLGRPIAVVRAIVMCDGSHPGHEVDVVTDGITAYAWGTADCELVGREGTEVIWNCRQPVGYDGEPCENVVRVDLAADHWTADVDDVDLLCRYGQPVEQN